MNVYICDDNNDHLQTLCKTVCQLSDEFPIRLRQFSSPEKLLSCLQDNDLKIGTCSDLVLLDIEMPVTDGITLGKKIKAVFPDIFLVFVTAYAEYAMKGYEANAFRYLQKPVSRIDFEKLFSDIALENSRKKRIIIKSGEGEILLYICDIIYISAEDKYTIVYTQSGYYITDESLKQYETKLVPLGFFRIHRKYLINMYHHKSISGNKLLLHHGIELPLSRRKSAEYKKKLFHFMKEDLV
ncbi:MAG: LytR/AlgR family response regulator transcription factor [Suilimivivens sp.]